MQYIMCEIITRVIKMDSRVLRLIFYLIDLDLQPDSLHDIAYILSGHK